MRLLETGLNLFGEHFVLLGLILIAGFVLSRVIYRLYFHPLAKFPGPRLAAITYLYEGWYDIVSQPRSQLVAKTKELHEKYGPIIRINPDELSAIDPSWIDEIYAGGGRRRNKSRYFLNQFGANTSSFATAEHDLHRVRRSALNKFFSKNSISKAEPLVHEKVQKFCDTILDREDPKRPVHLANAYSCMTLDVVSGYMYKSSLGLLDGNPEFTNYLRMAIMGSAAAGHIIKQWPYLFNIMDCIPQPVVIYLMPGLASFFDLQEMTLKEVQSIAKELQNGEYKGGERGHATVAYELFASKLPEQDKQPKRMGQEIQTLLGAGSETVAWTLTLITIHLLSNAQVLDTLKQEVLPHVKDARNLPSWSALEQLPYLHATVCEGLRLGYGVAARLPRSAPDEALFLKTKEGKEWIVPPNTPVAMSAVHIHQNGEIWPEPEKFKPERWFDGDGNWRKELDQYLISFNRGSRQCLGMQLGYCELYVGIAGFLARLDGKLKLHNTGIANVEYDHEIFTPQPAPANAGQYVVVVK